MAYAYSDIHMADFESSYLAIAGTNFNQTQTPIDRLPPEEVVMTPAQQEQRLFSGARRNCDLFTLTEF